VGGGGGGGGGGQTNKKHPWFSFSLLLSESKVE